jgi:hypothetical protein
MGTFQILNRKNCIYFFFVLIALFNLANGLIIVNGTNHLKKTRTKTANLTNCKMIIVNNTNIPIIESSSSTEIGDKIKNNIRKNFKKFNAYQENTENLNKLMDIIKADNIIGIDNNAILNISSSTLNRNINITINNNSNTINNTTDNTNIDNNINSINSNITQICNNTESNNSSLYLKNDAINVSSTKAILLIEKSSKIKNKLKNNTNYNSTDKKRNVRIVDNKAKESYIAIYTDDISRLSQLDEIYDDNDVKVIKFHNNVVKQISKKSSLLEEKELLHKTATLVLVSMIIVFFVTIIVLMFCKTKKNLDQYQ